MTDESSDESQETEAKNNQTVQQPRRVRFGLIGWIIAITLGGCLLLALAVGGDETSDYTVLELVTDINAERVQSITQRDDQEVTILLTNGVKRTLYIDSDSSIEETLVLYGLDLQEIGSNIEISHIKNDTTLGTILQLIITFAPMAFIVWLLWRMVRAVSINAQQQQEVK